MGRWRRRILLALITFFAGFATAIYALAPASDKTGGKDADVRRSKTSSKSEKFAMMFNSGMRRCLSFAEEKAAEVSEVVKAELAERQKDSGD